MTTTTVSELPRPDSRDTDRQIAASVRGLTSAAGLLPEDLAKGIGMTRATMYSRLNGTTSFKVGEVAAIAEYFDVKVGDLFDGLNGRLGRRAVHVTHGYGLPARSTARTGAVIAPVIDIFTRRPATERELCTTHAA